ncbi:MAG: hypothetical protein AABX53_01355 [Nanoarchaeota archaeon]
MHQKAFWSVLVTIALLTTLQLTSAQEAQEASVTVNIGYVANYNPLNITNASAPDLTDAIFLGNNSAPIGTHHITLPLTNGRIPLVDASGSEDVPGLYMERGQDANGAFIKFSLYGYNDASTYEIMKFTASLTNAKIVAIVNDSKAPYELQGDGICGINEENPGASTGNDEITPNAQNTSAEFCATLNLHIDLARLYYVYEDNTAPELTNIIISPTLPRSLDEGESEEFMITFTSDEYPLTTHFTLVNSKGTQVHQTSDSTITSASDLPLTYVLPNNLDADSYTLYMHVQDSTGNHNMISLGTITIYEDDSNSNDRRSRTLVSDEEREAYAFGEQSASKRTTRTYDDAESIVLDTSPKSTKAPAMMTWLIGFLVLNIILFLLVLIIAFLRR